MTTPVKLGITRIQLWKSILCFVMKTPKSKYTLEKTGGLQYNVALYAKANPSTKNSSPRPRSRLSCTYGFKSRSSRPQGSSPQRPQETERLRNSEFSEKRPTGAYFICFCIFRKDRTSCHREARMFWRSRTRSFFCSLPQKKQKGLVPVLCALVICC